MPFGPYSILIVLAISLVLFIWGRIRYDIVALLALSLAVAFGAVPFEQAFTGLSNTAVITVASVMILSQAISRSGILNALLPRIGLIKKSLSVELAVLCIITACLSAFMNNVGALSLMMPVAIQACIASKRSPSLVLMPLATSAILGGLVTAIGTPPNLLVSAYRQEFMGEPFRMFDFSYVGLPVMLTGILFLTIIGWRLMPRNRKPIANTDEFFAVQDFISEIQVPEKNTLEESTIKELEALVDGNITIVGLIRGRRKKPVLRSYQAVQPKDILLIQANPKDLEQFIKKTKFELVGHEPVTAELLKVGDITLVEAVVSQGSRIEDRSCEQIRLRSRFGMNLLALSRSGKPFKGRLRNAVLKAGDIVLLQGDYETLYTDAPRLGFLPLVERHLQVASLWQRVLPLLIFAFAVFLAAIQLLPIQIAFAGAVVLVMLFNVMPLRMVYDSVEWPIIILLAALIPVGEALQSTGGASMIADMLHVSSTSFAPEFTLAFLMIITVLLSDVMNNAATVVVMSPIAAKLSQAMGVGADPFLMAIAVAASCAFATPISHQNNTLVMGPGGYVFNDYLRLGLLSELVALSVAIPSILYFWPIHTL